MKIGDKSMDKSMDIKMGDRNLKKRCIPCDRVIRGNNWREHCRTNKHAGIEPLYEIFIDGKWVHVNNLQSHESDPRPQTQETAPEKRRRIETEPI